MSERPISVSEAQRARQREVLAALLKDVQTPLTPLAARMGVSTSALSRYVSGETILPTAYYPSLSAAFGISTSELVRRLGLVVPEPAGLRAELQAIFGPEDTETLEAAIRDLSTRTPSQRAETIARIRLLVRGESE